MTEKEIIEGCKSKNRKAQRAFVDTYSAYIFSICYRYMADHEVAKDALQECLVQVITKIDKYEDIGRFKSWVGTVTVKKCLDILRKEKRHKHAAIENVAEPYMPEQSSLNLERGDIIKFIDNIPENYRVAINMFLIEGYSHREISEQLDITESTSRSLVSRGRKMIIEAFTLERAFENKRIQNQTVQNSRLRII